MQQLKFICFLVLYLMNIQLSLELFDATLTSIVMIDPDDTDSFVDATGLRVKKVNLTQHVLSGFQSFILHQHYLTYYFKVQLT